MTLGLTDAQLRLVTALATPLPQDKRSLFLERLVRHIKVNGNPRHPTDDQLEVRSPLTNEVRFGTACRHAAHGFPRVQSHQER